MSSWDCRRFSIWLRCALEYPMQHQRCRLRRPEARFFRRRCSCLGLDISWLSNVSSSSECSVEDATESLSVVCDCVSHVSRVECCSCWGAKKIVDAMSMNGLETMRGHSLYWLGFILFVFWTRFRVRTRWYCERRSVLSAKVRRAEFPVLKGNELLRLATGTHGEGWCTARMQC